MELWQQLWGGCSTQRWCGGRSVASFRSCELNGHVTLSEEQELISIIWQHLVLLLLLEHAWCLSSADCA